MQPLLSPADPPPFVVTRAHAASDFVIVCDHAGRTIPQSLGSLGLTNEELSRHIAWDIGIADTGRELAERLDAFLITQTYSRLVIDCNRPPESPQSIVTLSERTPVPGNQNIAAADAERRRREIFDPYHQRIREELDRRTQLGRPTILIALHSFTPVYMDVARSLHAGVLYNRDTRYAHAVLEQLRAEPDLRVGDNEPYRASEATDYALVVHGERRGLLCVELEVRQDLIVDALDHERWAERLARVLKAARSSMFPT